MAGICMGSPAGVSSGPVPAPDWPPITEPNFIYMDVADIYANGNFTGTDTDVLSITLSNGMVMTKAGTGDTIGIGAEGLTFNNGCYLSWTPPATLSYDAIGVFGVLTTTVLSNDTLYQQPINLVGSGENLLRMQRKGLIITSDPGANTITGRGMTDFLSNVPLAVGVHFDTDPAYQEYGGEHAIWFNNRIAGAANLAETVTPTAWEVGKITVGTLHRGAIFYRYEGAGGPLYPAGGDSEWVMTCLEA